MVQIVGRMGELDIMRVLIWDSAVGRCKVYLRDGITDPRFFVGISMRRKRQVEERIDST